MNDKALAAYAALEKISAELQLPVSFHSDLTVHDLATIKRNPGASFAWVVGDRGTHMCVRIPTERKTKLEIFVSMQEAVCGILPRGHWYVWDGSALIKCRSAEHAHETLFTCRHCGEDRHADGVCHEV